MGKQDIVLEEFARHIGTLCSHTPLEPGRPLYWTVIANPAAGGFTIRSRWKKHYAALTECAAAAGKTPLRRKAAPSRTGGGNGGLPAACGLVLTAGRGEAAIAARALIEEARPSLLPAGASGERPLFLIISAGGDGTSLEILSALYHAPAELRQAFAVLRLPMGTGNDGADARELGAALRLLMEPAEIRLTRAIRLVTATPGKGPFLAFNILSVGLDAFVTHMTNRMKGRLPGDSYKLWVDIAALLYDRIYRVGFTEVRALEEGKEARAFREKLLLLAVGESGRRTYGAGKRILPDERNVCAIKHMPLLRKLALKGLFSSGGHAATPEALLFNASRVELSGEYPVLAQMDGETTLLEPGDFPAAIELSEPLLPVLSLKRPAPAHTG